MAKLKGFLKLYPAGPDALVFRSKSGGPLLETTVLNQRLYLALEPLKLPKAGLHAAFRRGCNRRWELAGLCLRSSGNRWVTPLPR
jgi:hypothetical protein